MAARRRKVPLAPVISTLQDIHAIVHWIAELRSTLAEAMVVPNDLRREKSFQRFWMYHAEAQTKLDTIKSPGLARRVAELQQQLNAVLYDASRAAIRAGVIRVGQPERRAVVVDFATAKARRAQSSA